MGDINMGKETFEGKKAHCTIGIIGHRGHGKTTLTDAIKKTLTTKEERNISLTSSIEYGAILVVSAIDGIMSQTAEVYMLDINEGGRDTGYFDGDRLQFYFKTTEILKSDIK